MQFRSMVACAVIALSPSVVRAADVSVVIPENDLQIWTLVQPTLERCIGGIATGTELSSCRGLSEFLRGANDRIQAAARAAAQKPPEPPK